MADPDITAALLSSGLLHGHLLTRLCLSDLVHIESLSTAFRLLVSSAPEEAWHAAIARSVPHSHHLARIKTGCQQAARQYIRTQRAIQAQDFTMA